MDGIFSWLLEKLKRFMPVSTYTERVEFAAHVGWSIALPAIGDAGAGDVGLQFGFLMFLCNTIVSEFWADGHLASVFFRRESRGSFVDFVTDVLTKIVPGALYVLIKLRS